MSRLLLLYYFDGVKLGRERGSSSSVLKTTRRETQKPFGSSISSWSEETFANLTASRTEAALIVASVVDSNYRIVGHRLQTIKQVRLFLLSKY